MDNLSTFVTVLGAVDGAHVQLFSDNVSVGTPTLASGLSVSVPLGGVRLTPGHFVTAIQIGPHVSSPHSPPEPVGSAPASLPAVTFLSLLHPCIDWVVLGGMITGADATILWNGIRIGSAVAAGPVVSVRVAFPSPVAPGDILEAFQSYSGGGGIVQGPFSQSLPLNSAPQGEMPSPTLTPPYACDLAVLVSGLQDGASLTVKHNALELAGYPFIGNSAWAALDKPVVVGDLLSGKQESKGCQRRGQFSSTPVGVNPAANLPTPSIGLPICPNALLLRVTNLRPGADVQIQAMKDPNSGVLISSDLGHARAWATECEFPLPDGWANDPDLVRTQGKFTIQLTESNCGKYITASAPIEPLPGAVATPSFQSPPVECARMVNVTNLTRGASVMLHSDQPDFPLSGPVWVSATTMSLYLYRPLRESEEIWISQTGCEAAAESVHTRVARMVALSPPAQEPPIRVPRGGAWFRNLLVGGRLYVFLNGSLKAGLDILSSRMFVSLPGLKIEDQIWAKQGLCTKYSPESSHERAEGGLMKVLQAPDPIQRGKPVAVTITAVDVESNAPINGSVRVSGPIVAPTGAAFALTIPLGAAGPPAQVEALGYLSGAINWHLVDPPPPPAAKLHLAVINQSGGQFTIAAVTWTVWQQTFAGFQLLATANGESVVIQPVVNGQYHIHADVLATRLSIGINELAEFRGAWKGPDAASTLLIGWTGVDLSRTFRLVTEAQTADTGGGYFTIYNPVVEL